MTAPTSLGAVLDGVDAALAGMIGGVTTHFGEEFLPANEAPPRIIWIPAPDDYERGQERHGPGPQPRSLATCEAGIEAHCWAAKDPADTTAYADLTAAWDLSRRVIASCRKVMGGNFSVRGGRFDPGAYTQLGRLYVLRLSFRLPVVEDTAWRAIAIADPTGTPGTSAALANTVTPPNP